MYDIDFIINDYLGSVNGRPPIRWSDARETWDADVLHVTDLNACPRAVGLRLRHEKQEPRPPQESRKFVLANFQHELLYRALDWAGVLIDKEIPVPLPDGWSGTADMVLSEFHDKDGPAVHVADSKNPVGGAKKCFADYPKVEYIRQVSVYAYFLSEIYKELAEQTEGQAFYLPLGGASRGLSVRFALMTGSEILYEMEAFEDEVRESVPGPLPLKLFWQKRRVYERKDGTKTISGTIAHGTDWRCRHCRFSCPNREVADNPEILCKSGKNGLSDLTSKGRHMVDDIQRFLLFDATGEEPDDENEE